MGCSTSRRSKPKASPQVTDQKLPRAVAVYKSSGSDETLEGREGHIWGTWPLKVARTAEKCREPNSQVNHRSLKEWQVAGLPRPVHQLSPCQQLPMVTVQARFLSPVRLSAATYLAGRQATP